MPNLTRVVSALIVAVVGLSGGRLPAQARQAPTHRAKAPVTSKAPTRSPDTALDTVAPSIQPSVNSGIKGMQPASITVKNGTLLVEANNSDLSQILRDISRETGMVVKGDVKETRVFGHYGPQDPPTLLNDLLTGLGYNIVMVGTAREGAPRELLLTSRNGGPSSPQKQTVPEQEPELGPGAIAHPPPEQVDDLNMRQYLNQQKMQKMQDAREKQQNNSQ